MPIDRWRSASRRNAAGDPRLLQRSQLPEPGPGVLWILAPRRQQHQPLQPDRPALERGINDAPRRVARRAELRRLAGQIHLDEHVRRGSGVGGRGVEPLQQIERIDRMDTGEGSRGLARLVRLQVADQVPLDGSVGRCRRSSAGLPGPCSRRSRAGPRPRRRGRGRRRTSSRPRSAQSRPGHGWRGRRPRPSVPGRSGDSPRCARAPPSGAT